MTSFEKSQWSKGCFAQKCRDNADIYVIERARMLNILKSLYQHFMRNKWKRNAKIFRGIKQGETAKGQALIQQREKIACPEWH